MKPRPLQAPTRRSGARRVGAVVGAAALVLSACSTGGTPSVGQPPVTVTSTVNQTTVLRTTSTVTATSTVTPEPADVLVVATFKDPSEFECTDASVESCWALNVVTAGPCPNGVYVSINVYKQGEETVLETLETTSAPVTEPLGSTIEVQLGQTGLRPNGETLEADLKEARCA